MKNASKGSSQSTIGLDLGDRFSRFCVLSAEGEIVEEGRVSTTAAALRGRFTGSDRCRIVMEVGTHSPWVSRLLTELGHEVLVANARKLRLIFENRRKSDRVDAEALARVGRLDPELLHSVRHRDLPLSQDLALVKGRDVLVRSRTQLVNHVRGIVKATGERLPKSTTASICGKPLEVLSEPLRQMVRPLMDAIAALTAQIHVLDKRIDELGLTRYSETTLLRPIDGVGPLVSLAFVLVAGDVERFRTSRNIGPYLGLVPGRAQSGSSDPQRRITKEGDPLLRRYLVQAAQRTLGPFGKDSDLRRFGLALIARGGAHGKKRAVVAVARKLAVLMLRLLKTGEVYEPLRSGTERVSVSETAPRSPAEVPKPPRASVKKARTPARRPRRAA